MNFPLTELGGAGPTINLAVANGFPPETYLSMLRPLFTDYRVVSLLPRALWGGEPVPSAVGDWESDVTADLLGGLNAHGLTGVIGIGHSFGGIATALAALRQPERFSALILLDPTILSHQIIEFLQVLRAEGRIDQDFPLAARALKRQRAFPSREDAYTYFRPRGVFKDWDDAAVRDYITYGLTESPDGLTLAWTPEWEAYYFMTGFTAIWETLPRLNGLVPTLIIRGAESDTYTAESAAEVRQLLPAASHVDLPGHGHLFPHTAPAQTTAIIRRWLETV